MHVKNEICIPDFYWKNLKGDHLGDIGIVVRMILKCISGKWGV
jgi:hypothetical protein